MGPYMDRDIIIKKTKPRNMSIVTKDTQSAVSFDSALTPKAPRLRAATMMMETKTIKKKAPPTMSPKQTSPIAAVDYFDNAASPYRPVQ